MAPTTCCVDRARSLLRKRAVVFLEICPVQCDDKLRVATELESMGCVVANRGEQVIAFPRHETARFLSVSDYAIAGSESNK